MDETNGKIEKTGHAVSEPDSSIQEKRRKASTY
jgi:hypothetical protein